MKIKPLARQKDVVVQNTIDEVLVYDLRENKAFCLNETSKMVWELCNGKHSVAEITDELTKHFSKPVSEDIVFLAISQFEKDGLLEDADKNFADYFGGLSRRGLIRKVGTASVIALPIITSILAPQAADAASVACTGCVAAGNNYCAGCSGPTLMDVYDSTDGSCSGPVTNTINFNCNVSTISIRDIFRT